MLLVSQFNLTSLFSQKRKVVVEICDCLKIKAIKMFEYEKNKNRYWDRAKLYKQIALLITEALYSKYSLLFLFNNVTSYSIYAKNTL